MSNRSMIALGALTVATRIFYSVAVDGVDVMNSGWISCILGSLFALPMILCLQAIDDSPVRVPDVFGKTYPAARCVLGVFVLLYSVYDGAISMRVLVGSALRIALSEFSEVFLLLLVAAFVFVCAKYSAESVGNATRFWNRIFYTILIIEGLMTIPLANFRLLTPILGPGIPVILDKALDITGIYTVLIALRVAAGRQQTSPGKLHPWLTVYLMTIGIALSLLLVYFLQTPAYPHEERRFAFQIDRVLTNGQFAASLQFLLITSWYASWLFTVLIHIVSGWKAISLIVPKWTGLIPLAVLVACVCGLSIAYSFAYRFHPLVSQLRLAVFMAPLIALAVGVRIIQRRQTHA